ncbi:uncharacterized protein L199_007880 [Kwoniella botswanensis]|uniref:uncharacterized protein n=1 Tax=Kwoniella botswanensis TaxID=1268659 RepID=UPI00315D0D7C
MGELQRDDPAAADEDTGRVGRGGRHGPQNCAECRRLKLRCDRKGKLYTLDQCMTLPLKHGIQPLAVTASRDHAAIYALMDPAPAPNQVDSHGFLRSLNDLLTSHGINLQGALDPPGSIVQSSPGPSVPAAIRRSSPSQQTRERSRSPSVSHRTRPFAYEDESLLNTPSAIRMHSPVPPPHFAYQYDDHPTSLRATTESPSEDNFGTLVIDKSGRSKYLGPTAGPEWRKDQQQPVTSLKESRAQSPSRCNSRPQQLRSYFPFEGAQPSSISTILTHLPPYEHAQDLLQSYYRYFAWNHRPASESSIQLIFDAAYNPETSATTSRTEYAQKLALLFITFALGALHNLELPPNDPSAEDYCMIAKACLAEGNFMKRPTIMGVQALVTMGHYHLETEDGRNGDSAWPLWGLAMRLIQSMGLHRDGERWNLPPDIVEDRRRLFWEAYCIDVFQANCFSRPSAIQRRHVDTLFPREDKASNDQRKGFLTAKYELAQISQEILDQAMDVRAADYADVQALQNKLASFERELPYDLRCREALLAATSMYPDPATARDQSPEVNKRNLRGTLEQYTLALNVSENFLFLQRPYFIAASQESPSDPTLSRFGASYLSVIERCNVIIQVVSGLYELFPNITSRHWFYWYHLFTAAVCFGTILIKDPHNVLAPLALLQVEKSIEVFGSISKKFDSPAMKRNHEWLLRLRNRVIHEVTTKTSSISANAPADQELDDEVVDLLTWRTELINCVTQDPSRRNLAPSSTVPATELDSTALSTLHALAQSADQSSDNATSSIPQFSLDTSIDDIFHQFWNPMMTGDPRADPMGIASLNWSDWDSTIPASSESNCL